MFDITKNWIILHQVDLKYIHKVNFYPSDNNFTQALLVTNIIPAYAAFWWVTLKFFLGSSMNFYYTQSHVSQTNADFLGTQVLERPLGWNTVYSFWDTNLDVRCSVAFKTHLLFGTNSCVLLMALFRVFKDLNVLIWWNECWN